MEYESDSAVVATFPEPVKIGTTVTIVGQIKSTIKFDLNLVCMPSGNKALHCSFRICQGRVIRNHSTRSPGFWGEEEVEGGWPIKSSGEFEIVLMIKEEHIEVSVDGKWFVNVLHRLPYSKITHINGSVGANFTSIKFDKTIKSEQ